MRLFGVILSRKLISFYFLNFLDILKKVFPWSKILSCMYFPEICKSKVFALRSFSAFLKHFVKMFEA